MKANVELRSFAGLEWQHIMPIKFVPHRFKSAAEYYVRGRLSYPPALISRVASLTGLTAQDRVLDLGCGPGFLAVAFASHARR